MGTRITRPSENELPKRRYRFVVSIVTDFEAHALWMDACVDLYCVAAEETKARLVARGAPAENAVATGIPIAAKFSSKPDARAVRKTLGLRDDLPVLLVLSGGFGMGPVAEILAELDKVPQPFQTVVVTGRNEELRRELAAQTRQHPTHVLGFATNMHELMAVADLIITKPGGLTSSEALALGKPLFILNPIPGQEAANSDFLLERGAAAKVNRVEDLPFRIEQLLGSKKLAEMAKAAKALGRPQSASAVCREVLKRLDQFIMATISGSIILGCWVIFIAYWFISAFRQKAIGGTAKPGLHPGTSDSAWDWAGILLAYPALAAAHESLVDTAHRLGTGDWRRDLCVRIVRDALGALDAGRELEQRRHLQARPRIDEDRALSVRAASDLHRFAGDVLSARPSSVGPACAAG